MVLRSLGRQCQFTGRPCQRIPAEKLRNSVATVLMSSRFLTLVNAEAQLANSRWEIDRRVAFFM